MTRLMITGAIISLFSFQAFAVELGNLTTERQPKNLKPAAEIAHQLQATAQNRGFISGSPEMGAPEMGIPGAPDYGYGYGSGYGYGIDYGYGYGGGFGYGAGGYGGFSGGIVNNFDTFSQALYGNGWYYGSVPYCYSGIPFNNWFAVPYFGVGEVLGAQSAADGACGGYGGGCISYGCDTYW